MASELSLNSFTAIVSHGPDSQLPIHLPKYLATRTPGEHGRQVIKVEQAGHIGRRSTHFLYLPRHNIARDKVLTNHHRVDP
ncbi:hypothetical protein ACXR0O_25035 [Verrucomicrobiota bacterium sgz303538]